MLYAIARFLFRLPQFRGRNRAIRILMGHMPATPTYYGPRIRPRPRDYTNRACVFGDYGDRLSDLIATLPRDGLFLDIGANLGIYSLLAGRHLTQGRVISLEPNPKVYSDLVENTRLNGLTNVTPLNFGMAGRTELLRFAVSETHTGGGHVATGTEEGATATVLLLDIAHLRPVLDPDLDRQTLCKIDTEGFELQILETLRDAGLLKRIERFFIEIDEANLTLYGGSVAALYALMEAEGYRPALGPDPTAHYDELFTR